MAPSKGISDYNRYNALLISLRSSIDKINPLLNDTTKKLLVVSGLNLIFIIFSIFFIKFNIYFIILNLSMFSYNSYMLYNVIKTSHFAELHDIMYSDKYRNTNLNNEEILNMIYDVKSNYAKLVYLKGKIFFDTVITIFSMLFFLLSNLL